MCHKEEIDASCQNNVTQFNDEHPSSDDQCETEFSLLNPHCVGMSELPSATTERMRVSRILRNCRNVSKTPNRHLTLSENDPEFESSALFKHLAYGLAYTLGSALGTTPPQIEDCVTAYQVSNGAGLTAGARAWSKHCHRSRPQSPERQGPSNTPVEDQSESDKGSRSGKLKRKGKSTKSDGWWGTASGPIPVINENSLALFWKIMNGATWRNLHWLPHKVLVYEVRVPEGYGMRWARDLSESAECATERPEVQNTEDGSERSWIFRGFVEPQMENGHELGWKHTIQPIKEHCSADSP